MAGQVDLHPLEAKEADVCMCSCPRGRSEKEAYLGLGDPRSMNWPHLRTRCFAPHSTEKTQRKLLEDQARQGQTKVPAGPQAFCDHPPELTTQMER